MSLSSENTCPVIYLYIVNFPRYGDICSTNSIISLFSFIITGKLHH